MDEDAHDVDEQSPQDLEAPARVEGPADGERHPAHYTKAAEEVPGTHPQVSRRTSRSIEREIGLQPLGQLGSLTWHTR